MTVHSLQLATEPFNAILEGRKTIESRLYDEKRQTIQIGDTLVFTNRENTEQTIEAREAVPSKIDGYISESRSSGSGQSCP